VIKGPAIDRFAQAIDGGGAGRTPAIAHHRPVMTIVCCVCREEFGSRFCTPEMDGRTTHGYCTVCFDRAMEQVKAYWQVHEPCCAPARAAESHDGPPRH